MADLGGRAVHDHRRPAEARRGARPGRLGARGVVEEERPEQLLREQRRDLAHGVQLLERLGQRAQRLDLGRAPVLGEQHAAPVEGVERRGVEAGKGGDRHRHSSAGWVRRTPERTTATDSDGARCPAAPSASRPATPAVPVSSASMPVASQAMVFASMRAVLVHDERPAARDEHRALDGEPVVGLVVEDAVGHARGRGLPRAHVARAVVGGGAQGVMDACRVERLAGLGAQVLRAGSPCARASGQAPRVCTVSRRGGAGDRPQRHGIVEPERDPGRERAAAHLDDDPVERRARGTQAVRPSPRRASRRPRWRGRCPAPGR